MYKFIQTLYHINSKMPVFLQRILQIACTSPYVVAIILLRFHPTSLGLPSRQRNLSLIITLAYLTRLMLRCAIFLA